MNAPLPPAFVDFADHPSIIYAVGVVVAFAAYYFGRRLFAGRTAPPPTRPGSGLCTDVFVHGSATERRAAPRRKGNCVEVVVVEEPVKPAMDGWVRDRSVGGLCLLLDQPVPEGRELQVRPRNTTTTLPWTAVEVRSCRPGEDGFELHCRFIKTPEYNVLLLFG
jgi:hypothetical protein